jgi:hypothetical protein
MIGLDPSLYGTHSLRRTKATLIYRKTGKLRPLGVTVEKEIVRIPDLDRLRQFAHYAEE